MSHENPTALSLGQTGRLNGRDYRVVGRSVLGESEGSGTYYWNEFNLEAGAGESAILVYDETEPVSQWRLFRPFEPENPLTAAAAATLGVGDRVNLTGHEVRVTFRGTSRVCFVEGLAPEGEAEGTEAEYFNAEAGDLMQVVSWTGEAVEYYRGITLARSEVAMAFRLPRESLWRQNPAWPSGQARSAGSKSGGNLPLKRMLLLLTAGLVLVFLLLFLFEGRSGGGGREGAATPLRVAGPPPLRVGSSGKLAGQVWRVTAHAVVSIAEVGAKWERHEYELATDSGAMALLLCGAEPGSADWIFLEPLGAGVPLTARQAAAKQIGDLVELAGYTGRVDEIFLSTVEQADAAEAGSVRRGPASYGFRCMGNPGVLFARWTEAGIQTYRGRTVPAKATAAGFRSAP